MDLTFSYIFFPYLNSKERVNWGPSSVQSLTPPVGAQTYLRCPSGEEPGRASEQRHGLQLK